MDSLCLYSKVHVATPAQAPHNPARSCPRAFVPPWAKESSTGRRLADIACGLATVSGPPGVGASPLPRLLALGPAVQLGTPPATPRRWRVRRLRRAMRAPTSRHRAQQRCWGGGTAPPPRAAGLRLGHAVQAARTGVCAAPPARRRLHAAPHAAHLVCAAGLARGVRGSPRRCSRRRSSAPCSARRPPRGAPRGGTARCIGTDIALYGQPNGTAAG